MFADFAHLVLCCLAGVPLYRSIATNSYLKYTSRPSLISIPTFLPKLSVNSQTIYNSLAISTRFAMRMLTCVITLPLLAIVLTSLAVYRLLSWLVDPMRHKFGQSSKLGSENRPSRHPSLLLPLLLPTTLHKRNLLRLSFQLPIGSFPRLRPVTAMPLRNHIETIDSPFLRP